MRGTTLDALLAASSALVFARRRLARGLGCQPSAGARTLSGLQQPLALLELRSDRRADAALRHELRRRMARLSALP